MNVSATMEYYDKYGKLYHKKRTEEGKLFNEFIEMPAVSNLLGKENFGKKVLDIGCGSGIYSKYLSEIGFDVTAIDVSGEMLSIAKEYCKGLNVKFIQTSFEDFIETTQFDLILGSFVLGYFDDLRPVFYKMNSLLNRDGKIIVSAIHPIRMSAKERSFLGYYIENYFDSNIYNTIIVDGEDSLSIRKHTVEDISESAYYSNLLLERVIEPKPIKDTNEENGSSFFLRCPSVIIFQLIKKFTN